MEYKEGNDKCDIQLFKTTYFWLIDFNGMSTCVGLFYVRNLRIVYNVRLYFNFRIGFSKAFFFSQLIEYHDFWSNTKKILDEPL